MAVPPLRIPLGVDMAGFEKGMAEAKSRTAEAADFIAKAFAKQQLKLVVNSDEFKPAVQSAAKFVGDQFDKVKPQLQSFTQAAVKETTEAGLKVAGVMAQPAIKGSFQAFTSVGIPAAQGLAQALLPIAARALAVYAAFELVSSAVGAARNQIAEMVAVADKAANLNLSPSFLQQFEGESRKLKVTTDELDQALQHAFNATKDKSPIDIGKWEVAKERITDVELSLRVYNDQLAKAAGTQLNGLVMFRDADTQQQKVIAVLTAMRELEQIGQRTAALDVGEKMFGSQFVDRIRQGKTSAEEMLATIEKLKASGDGIFPDSLVQRAKAVDDQLKLSEDRLSRAMKPAWDELASVILTIKGYWADIVDLMAKAVEFANRIGIGTSIETLQNQLKEVNDRLAGKGSGATGLFDSVFGMPDFVRKQLLASKEDLENTIAQRRNTYFGPLDGSDIGPPVPGIGRPSRGTGEAPTLRQQDTGRDRFEASAEAMQKRIAGLEAEASAIDLGTAARERSKVAAELETVAKQVNAAAGLGANVVTAEQRAQIDKLSEAYGRAAEAIERARSPLATYARESANVAKQLNQFSASQLDSMTDSLAGVVTGTKSVSDAFKSMANSIISDLARIAIRQSITGPIASGLMGLFGGGGGLSPIDIGGYSMPRFASGTDYAPGGMALVGERGPEIVNLPRGSQVVPNDIVRGGVGGGGTITYAPSIDARGASPEAVARLAQIMDQDRASFERRTVAVIKSAQKRRIL